MENIEKLRIQFEDFNKSHFEISPIWEFAIDEEGEDGQDETTLKPRLDLKYPDPSEGLLIIEGEFMSKSGRKYSGLCSPSFDNSLSSIQPYIFAGNQMANFWMGISQPDDQTKEETYKMLNETSESLFPIILESILPNADGSKLQAQIDGFMWIKLSDDTIYVEK
ncbi:hypothetical protein [Sabulibacter ruber]|uniref:hypothetical protein n=1 Tax=Sabulibacter ruber TaxID=2811901 RepID=UPI001A96F2D4|nr:hypothetical protein [Sabulibacter ruber]